MQHGSPLWQTAFLLAGILFLLWEIWRGWRAGFARSGMYVAGIFVSFSIGCLAAKLAAAPFGGFNNPAGFVAGILVGGSLGIFLLIGIWIFAAVFFKRTKHQRSGIFRILWGAGGAFFGLLLGLAILWGGITVIRSLGAFAESRAGARLEKSQPTQPKLADGLVTLKESLELGSAGRFLESIDPLPPDYYELVLQIGNLTSNQQAMRRFLEYPGLQQILQNPRVADFVNDPAVIRPSKEGNFFPLLSKGVAAAVADPAVIGQLSKIDLRAALKFALESPEASPSPSQASVPKKRE